MAEIKKYIDQEGLRKAFKLIDDKYVAKEAGKGLSTNDFSDIFKAKLEAIEAEAQVNKIEKVTVNGEELEITDKTVNIVIPQTDAEAVEEALGFMPLNEEQIDAKIDEAKEELEEAIEQATSLKLKREIVEELPAIAEADSTVIYMIPKDPAQPENGYTEYMVISGAWEKIGDTTTDLSDYYVKAETEQKALEIATDVAENIVIAKDLVAKNEVNDYVNTATEIDIMEAFGLMEGKQAGIIKASGEVATFETIEEALLGAEEGDVVQLVADVEIPADATIASGAIIDLNGHKVSVKE